MKKNLSVSTDERLISEWNWKRNQEKNLDPNVLTLGSTKKVWWICAKEHEFEARIDNRYYSNVGCPYCAGKKAIIGSTDLASQRPDLLEEWDYLQNQSGPEKYTLGSNKKVYWVCKQCNNRFEMMVKSRVEGNGCPQCAKKKRATSRVAGIIAKTGSFADLHPELLTEWDFLKNQNDPNDYTEKSSCVVWWICSVCGGSYKKNICGRVNGGGCPYCSGHKALIGFNDIESQYPELAKEWDYEKNAELLPSHFTKGSDKLIWWRCHKNHSWRASVSSRVHGSGCPYCSGQRCITGENDLQTLNPALAEEWFQEKNGDLKPCNVSAGSNKKVWWKCRNCGREWEAAISSRNAGNGCSQCSAMAFGQKMHKIALERTGPISETHPYISQEWDNEKNGELTPDMFSRGSDQQVWWKCRKGHSWCATISSRVAGNNCPICSSETRTSFAEQSLFYYISQVVSAENRARVFGKEIDIYIPSLSIGIEYNGKYWHRRSKEKDEAKVVFFREKGIRIVSVNEGSVNSIQDDIITYNFKHRDYDSLKKAIESVFYVIKLTCPDIDIIRDSSEINSLFVKTDKKNSIAVKASWLCKEWDYELNGTVTPEMIGTGSDKKMHWVCAKGHEWMATVSSRVAGRGCPYCANRVVLKGYNDLATLFPEIAAEWNIEKNRGKTPDMILAGSHSKAWWICSKGHEWFADIHSRTGKEKCGCPVCAGKKPKHYTQLD